MADTFQFSSAPMAGDIGVKNAGLTDIPAGVCVHIDGGNLIPTVDSICAVRPTTSATVLMPLGITLEIIKANGTGRVRTQGMALLTASGTVTAGDIVMSGTVSTKEGYGATQTTALPQVGQAMSTATDGNTFLCRIAPAFNH